VASYLSTPAFDPQKGSYPEPTQKSESYVAGDGGGRVYVPASKTRFYIKHNLSTTDVNTLLAFYETNKLLPVDFTWVGDGGVYSCYFEEKPDVRPDENNRWEVSVRLIQA
jgi:hypothetical protein